MRTLKSKLLLTALSALLAGVAFAQPSAGVGAETVVTFKFLPEQDMFYIPWDGNDAELTRLYTLVEEYRNEISSRAMPVYVDGYCASLPTAKENLRAAFVRANRVKSELITRKGLSEEHFITKNHITAYAGTDGVRYKDMVVVTLRIPVKEETPQPEVKSEAKPEVKPEARPEPRPEPQPVTEKQPDPKIIEIAEVRCGKPYGLAFRTNLLYDALLLPTLGVEWRVNERYGVRIDGSYAHWGSEKGKVQKAWMVNPEVRRYQGTSRRFYVGIEGHAGEVNVYKYPLGSIMRKLYSRDTGYQGKFYGGGIAAGYQLGLTRSWLIDFNVGLGYTRFEYDTFGMSNGVRIYKGRDLTKNFWGPTQAGINLIWTIGGHQ